MWHAWERRENCTRFWWESPNERDRSEDQCVGGKMGSKWILGRLAWGVWLDSTGPVSGCFECGDEPSGSCTTELDWQFICTAVLMRGGGAVACWAALEWYRWLLLLSFWIGTESIINVDAPLPSRGCMLHYVTIRTSLGLNVWGHFRIQLFRSSPFAHRGVVGSRRFDPGESFRPVLSKLRPAGRIRPTVPFYLARGHDPLMQNWKVYIPFYASIYIFWKVCKFSIVSSGKCRKLACVTHSPATSSPPSHMFPYIIEVLRPEHRTVAVVHKLGSPVVCQECREFFINRFATKELVTTPVISDVLCISLLTDC
jgi:hypothetical protein